MSYLLSLSLGPVQEFIAAARRTGDLAAGSRLLVEASRAAARTVGEAGALIFPANLEGDIPNKILCRLDRALPAEVAGQAKEEARRIIRERWKAASEGLPQGVLAETVLAEEQVDGFLEFYAAWWPLEQGGYQQAREGVERLLAGRKALRDFAPPAGVAGRPKSPLDPSRECVLAFDPGTLKLTPAAQEAPGLHLKPRETLDAVSLLKRRSGRSGPPSTSLMALSAVLPRLKAAAGDQVAALQQIADASDGRVDLGDLFFPERLVVARPDGPVTADLSEETAKRANRLRTEALQLARCGRPSPYYAILVGDGDQMGRLLDGKTEEEHRAVSEALSGFAGKARVIVGQHDGFLVYSGGDDVLALLPTNRAIDCAEALRMEFAGQVDGTLSVGVAIVHHLESLQVSLERAREAERAAKKTRDTLAVALHTRGGTPVTVALGWGANDGWTADAAATWSREIEAFRNGLARGFPYELRRLARELRGTGLPGDLVRAEAERIAHRKKGGQGWKAPEKLETAEELAALAQLTVVARFLAELPGTGEPAEQERTDG